MFFLKKEWACQWSGPFFSLQLLLLTGSGRGAIIAFSWIPPVTPVGSNGQFQLTGHTDGPGYITWVTKQN